MSSFICGRIQSEKQLPRAARQKGAGNLCWVRRGGRLKGDGILLCPSRKTLSPPDTQQKLSLPWRLAGNGLPVSQSCSWVMHRASCEQHGPVLCLSNRSAIGPLLSAQPARVPACLGGTRPCASPGFSPAAGRRSSISAQQIIKLMNVSFSCFLTALASNLCPDYD